MKNEDRERDFRLKPTKRRPSQHDEARVWSVAFKRIMHLARMSSSKARSGVSRQTRPSFTQRCAVRITYSSNKSTGQWKAHGHYIERESAAGADSLGNRGFGPSSDTVRIPATLNKWQAAGDPRLPSRYTDVNYAERLEGRVLGHGEDGSTGRSYMMLEGTDHYVHFIYRTPELEAARKQGKLATNSFVRLTRLLIDQRLIFTVQYFGDSDDLLANKHYLRIAAQGIMQKGNVPIETGMSGWLGRYEARLTLLANDMRLELKDAEKYRSGPDSRG